MEFTLGPLAQAVRDVGAALHQQRVVPRIWQGDPLVWSGSPETPELSDRLGWLDPFLNTKTALANAHDAMRAFAQRVDRVVLAGMGGSSLTAEVLWRAWGPAEGGPDFVMLDSTAPEAVMSAASDPSRTGFVVSSKSGSTLETRCLFEYYWRETGEAPDRFIVITDPGSPLEARARERGCRLVVLGDPCVGGRFSALTPFGLAPSAILGHPVSTMLERAHAAARAARADLDPAGNPGGWLGLVLGVAAQAGRNKLGLVLSPRLAALGLWLEQLIAESTGKEGRGIVPVPMVVPPDPATLGDDWVVVSIGLAQDGQRPDLSALSSAGHPVLQWQLDGLEDLGAEFFRWEFATAVAGAVLGINPFDQPDVSGSKATTEAVLAGQRAIGVPIDDTRRAAEMISRMGPRDYLALLVYAAPTPDRGARVARIAATLRASLARAVTWGFGPRYLHSTGQLHKGGPPLGHFIQVVDTGGDDLSIPGESFGFRTLMAAQAAGDFAALETRGRPIIRLADLESLERLERP